MLLLLLLLQAGSAQEENAVNCLQKQAQRS